MNKTDERIIYLTKTFIKVGKYQEVSEAWDEAVYGGTIQTPYNFYKPYKLTDYSAYPKIINNRVKFERQLGVTYKYKGKEYTLKTPVMQEDYEVVYYKSTDFGF